MRLWPIFVLIFLVVLSYFSLSTKTSILELIPLEKVKPYQEVNQTSYFFPTIEVSSGNFTLYKVKSNLISFKSSLCPKEYPNYCGGKCYQDCKIGFFYCFENGTGTCIDVEGDAGKLYKKLVDIFKGNYSCFLYDVPDDVMRITVKIIPNFGSSKFPYLLDIIYLYNWTKNNIKYVPGYYTKSRSVEDVLEIRAGKCDEQAKLLAALIASIGGVVRVRIVPGCQHAWAEVFIPDKNVKWIVDEIDYYTGTKSIEYFEDKDGIWIPLDTSGSNRIGSFLPTCKPYLNESKELYYCKTPCPDGYFYFNKSCFSSCPGGTGISENNKLKCLECPSDFPFTYNNTCVNACPPGTGLASDGKTCVNCPKGYFTYNNTCVSCPKGYYLGIDGKCHRV